MKYLKDKEDYIDIPKGFCQKFFHDPNVATNLTQVASLKYNKVIDDDDLKIIEFVYDCAFATEEQLERFCSFAKIENCKERLASLFSAYVLNRFGLVDAEDYMGRLPNDAKYYYSLANAGSQLLQQYSNREYIDWEAGKIMMGSRKISKRLLQTEVYLNMLTCGQNFVNMEPNPEFYFKLSTLKAVSSYSFKLKDGTIDYILLDIVFKTDKISEVRHKITAYESLLTTRFWQKYYPDAGRQPMLFIYTDSDETAKWVASEIRDRTKLKVFLVSTIKRVREKQMSETGAFLKCDGENFVEIGYGF